MNSPRTRIRLLRAILALLAVGWPAIASADAERVRARIPGTVPVVIEAAQITLLPSGIVRATGSVQITRGEDSLTAGEAAYNPHTEQIEARGDAVLSQPGRRLTGDHLTYSARTGEVSGEAIRAALSASAPGVEYRFQGQTISGTRESYRLQGGLFTTCEKDPPHFAVRAGEILLRPGETVTARRVSLLLMGRRLFTIPSYTARLDGDDSQTTLLPHLTLGRTDRLGLRSDLRLGVPSGGTADLYGVLSLRHTLRAGVGLDGIGSLPLGLRAGFKEEAPNRFVSGLTVTVLPAVTFHLPEIGTSGSRLGIGMTRMRPTLTALAEDIRGGKWTGDTRFRLIAGGSAGSFTEHPTEVSTTRLALAGALEARPYHLTPHTELSAALRGRLSYYGTGARYGIVSPELGLSWRTSPYDALRATIYRQIAGGETPFFFDRAPASHSIFLGWLNQTPQRKIRIDTEYDLHDGALYGWSIGYSRRLECLQPGIKIHQQGKDLGLGFTLEIPGFGS